MKVNQAYQAFAMQEITQRQDTKNSSENENFSTLFGKSIEKENDAKIDKKISDADVEQFKSQLTSMGASNFWLNFNMEKIQSKIEEKRKELATQLGLDKEGDEALSLEEREEALANLDEMLKDYIKQLLKEMEAKKQLENQGDKPNLLSKLLSGN